MTSVLVDNQLCCEQDYSSQASECCQDLLVFKSAVCVQCEPSPSKMHPLSDQDYIHPTNYVATCIKLQVSNSLFPSKDGQFSTEDNQSYPYLDQ